jgi:hypothetical protein
MNNESQMSSNKVRNSQVLEGSPGKTSDINKKRKSEFSDISNVRTQVNDKSMQGGETPESRNIDRQKAKTTLNRSKTSIQKEQKKSKRRVTFREKQFLDIVNVESYKKYNMDMSYCEPDHEEPTRCRCLVF